MSNNPNNTMPPAGGTSLRNDDDRSATGATGSRIEPSSTNYSTGDTPRAQQSGSQFGGYSTGDTSRAQQSSKQFADSSGSFRQPDRHREDSYSRDRRGSLMEKARDNKTGIALGVAVGAIAATALPLMFSGKKKSGSRHDVDYSADLYVENPGRNESDGREGVVTAQSGTVGATNTSPVVGSRDQATTTGQKKRTNEA